MPFDRTITLDSLVHTAGIRTAAILAALYNAAVKIGHGEKDPGPDTITLDQASAILKAQPKGRNGRKLRYFDYLYGKRLKLDLSEAYTSGIVAGQYDFYFGQGTAKKAIEILKTTGDPCHPDIIALHATAGAAVAARMGSTPRHEPGTITEGNLAEAMELTDPGPRREDETDLEGFRRYIYERSKETPCTTIDL